MQLTLQLAVEGGGMDDGNLDMPLTFHVHLGVVFCQPLSQWQQQRLPRPQLAPQPALTITLKVNIK